MLEEVKRLIESHDWIGALRAIEPFMEKYPMDPMGLFLLGQIMLETDKQTIAYPIYKLGIQLEPKRPEMWLNMGKAAGELHFYEEEEACFKKALKYAKEQGNEGSKFVAIQNLATCAVHQTNPDKALHWAKKSLAIKETRQTKVDVGFSQLMQRNFKDGWKNYNEGRGWQKFRDITQYQDEPDWDGSPDKHVIIYGEQGIGDQIAFAGAVRDARKVSKNVVLHVNPKLVNLFSRSFILETHGYGESDDLKWLDNREFDASTSMTKIQEFFREETHKFPGKQYLVADSGRRIQWKALLDSLGDKLKIGIAWTGGVQLTQREARSSTLENLLPLLKQEVTWVNLEYKDRTEEIKEFEKKHGIKIHNFPWALQTKDYDDTAALVAELDLVISVPTSVVHLAGGLGVPCWCMVQPQPHFMFGLEGQDMPYYNSVRLYRRKKDDWGEVITSIGEDLNELRLHHPRGTRSQGVTRSSSGISADCDFRQRSVFHSQYPNSG